MIKRLVVICCILLVPTIAAAQGTTNYGDFWAGGQIGGLFSLDRNVDVSFQGQRLFTADNVSTDPAFSLAPLSATISACHTGNPGKGISAWLWTSNGTNLNPSTLCLNGDQFALSLLGRLQYPLMGNERFTRGRIVPFLMFGPAVVWTNSDFIGGNSNTSTDFGLVAEVGVEFFVCPHLSIGPSFRYRYVCGTTYKQAVSTDHTTIMGLLRLA